jgi:large subunit ribosomal protein L5
MPMRTPTSTRLTKIVVNMGVGEAIQNSKILDSAVNEMALITGQNPDYQVEEVDRQLQTRAGMSIGCKSHCAKSACTSSWTDSSMWHSHGA